MKKKLFRLLTLCLTMTMLIGVSVAQDGPVVLTLFTTESDPPQLEALNAIIDSYHDMHSDVFIDVVVGTPATRGDRTRVLVTSGIDAGIFELEPAFAREWAAAGFLLPLNDLVDTIGGMDAYYPGSLFTEGDTAYGIPYATSVYGLWYRTDILEAAGIEPPTNYDEFVAAASALTDPDNGVYGFSMPGATNASVSYFSTMMWQNCVDYYTPEGELTFDSPEALEAVQRWSALAEYAPPGFESWSFGDQITAFITGRVAMSMYAGRLGARMPDQAPQLEAVSDLTPLPWSYTDGSPYVTYGNWSRYAISANSEHPEVAKDFLAFFLSGDQLAAYDATVPGHMVPPLADVGDRINAMDSEYMQNHADWLDFFNGNAEFINHPANNMGSVVGCEFNSQIGGPAWGGAIFSTGGVIDTMLQEIYLGAKSPEEAWGDAVAAMVEIQAEWEANNS